MKTERCFTKRCKGKPTISVMGQDLCDKCWIKHCQEGQEQTTDRKKKERGKN